MSVINKAYKYRLYPSKEQQILFAKTFGCCRKVYNLMLADKKKHYEESGEMIQTTPAQYKDKYPFLREVDSLALANEQINLQRAYRNFFRDPKIGFPHFKSAKRDRRSYTTNNQNGTVCIQDKGIRLPKLGVIKASIHRFPGESWKLKSATISRDPDGRYYASVLFEYEQDIPVVSGNHAIGLDYKSDGLYMDSNGVFPQGNHKYYRKAQRNLSREQRRLSRKKGARKGEVQSNNYKKQKIRVARIHKHVSNQRKDFLHKLSTEIANQYDIVCVEDLNMRALANKGFHNGKATNDNGYGMFLSMLEYKLQDRGKILVRVDKWYPSSQICCHCGNRHKLELSERIYHCPDCGMVMDRDHNAAINILREGLRMLDKVS